MGNCSCPLTKYQVWSTKKRLSQRGEVEKLTLGRRSEAWEEIELLEHCSPLLCWQLPRKVFKGTLDLE